MPLSVGTLITSVMPRADKRAKIKAESATEATEPLSCALANATAGNGSPRRTTKLIAG
jgi:hypothetical protein